MAQKKKNLSGIQIELENVLKSAPTIPEASRADIGVLAALQAKRLSIADKIAHLNRQAGILETASAKYEILATDISQFNRDISEMLADAGIANREECLVAAPPARATEEITKRKAEITAEISSLLGTPQDSSDQTLGGVDRRVAETSAKLTLTANKQKEYEKNQADRKNSNQQFRPWSGTLRKSTKF